MRCSGGHVKKINPTGLRLPASRGILSIEPGLDGVTGGRRRFGGEGFSVGDR